MMVSCVMFVVADVFESHVLSFFLEMYDFNAINEKYFSDKNMLHSSSEMTENHIITDYYTIFIYAIQFLSIFISEIENSFMIESTEIKNIGM